MTNTHRNIPRPILGASLVSAAALLRADLEDRVDEWLAPRSSRIDAKVVHETLTVARRDQLSPRQLTLLLADNGVWL